MDQRPGLETAHVSEKLPILIVDKNGFIGSALAARLKNEFLIVLVTAAPVGAHDNIIHIPYRRKIPKIPDNAYSHIFVAYNGEQEILDMLSVFVQKAQQIKAQLLLITSLAHSSKKLLTQLHKPANNSVQMILYGETFDNEGTEVNETNFFIKQARMYGRIEVPNAGLGKLFPVYIEDVLTMILTIAFTTETHRRIIYAFSHHPITQISVARMLQKIDPMLKIDFKKQQETPRNYVIPEGGQYFYSDYDLESRLRIIDLKQKVDGKIVPQRKLKLAIPDPEANKKRLILVTTFLFAIFIAPIFLTIILAASGAGLLSWSLSQAEQGKFASAKQTAQLSGNALAATDSLLPGLVLTSSLLPKQHAEFTDYVNLGQDVIVAELDALQALQLLQNIYEDKSLDPKNDFLRSLATLKNTLLTFQKLKAEGKLPKDIAQKMEKFNGVSGLIEGTIDTWPALFGFEGRRKYLVLFQNNMELRPGGGFIGSYGILPVKDGTFEKLQVHDVYDADGQLKTKINPPYGLRRYLGASNWFMRDSNFDLDYTRNAVQAAQFLTLETGEKVDGVIAIDTTFLKNLLTVLGSVHVPDYNETVTPDNFYMLTQNHAEKGFFPGSTQKKDFLRSLTNAMMTKLFTERQYPYEKLLAQIENSVRQKHLLFAFSDEGIQNVFTVNGLSSSLQEGRKADKNSFLDFFSIIDANVGGNKANYYVRRLINQQVAFDGAGGLQVSAEAVYLNTSVKGSPYGGDYKNYVRFILPKDAELQQVYIDNNLVETLPAITDPDIFTADGFIPPSGLEIEQTEILNKQVVGFFVNVPVATSKTVKITYNIPSVVDLKQSSFSYNLRLFKQPGAGEDPYTLFLSYPNGFEPVKNDSHAADVGGKLNYQTQLSEDKDFNVTFSRK